MARPGETGKVEPPKEPRISSHPVRSSLALAGASLIWGLAFVAQRVSLDSLGPFTFNGLRFALGALCLWPFAHVLPTRLPPDEGGWKPAFVPGIIAGAVLATAAGLQQVGLQWTTAGKAAFLTGFYILLVPVFGLFLKRRPHAGVWWGAAVGLAGLYFLSITEAWTIYVGDALQLLGAVFWAAHILVIDRVAPRLDPLKLSVVQYAACALVSLAVAAPTETLTWGRLDAGLVPLVYSGVGSVGIAYTLQVVGQRGIAPGPAALLLSLEAVFAALGGGLLLGETLGFRELVGCALMLAGMAVAQIWPRRAVPSVVP